MRSYFRVEIVPYGQPAHFHDVAELRARGIPLPHDYVSSPLGDPSSDWIWLRVLDANGALSSGFAMEIGASLALPGTLIGRVDRVGRRLHEPVLPQLGGVLASAARAIPRLQRLDIRLFDEDSGHRAVAEASICACGGVRAERHGLYTRTVAVELVRSADGYWQSMKNQARYKLRRVLRAGVAEIRPIIGYRFIPRMQALYEQALERTGGSAARLDFGRLAEVSAGNPDALLIGVFLRNRPPPNDLVAFALGHFHGDHGSYEIGASDRAHELRQVPMGYLLINELLGWVQHLGGGWFDMGGVPNEEALRVGPLRGIVRFKHQFSRREIDIASELTLVVRPGLALAADTVRAVATLVGLRKSR